MMSPSTRLPALLTLALAPAVWAIAPASSQVPGCNIQESRNQLIVIYQCQERLRIMVEARARVAAIELSGQLAGLRLEGGAAYVETGGPLPEGFQVITPHGIARVRGTRFAVDSGASTTAVFVREGRVAVKAGDSEVTLETGQGVDIDQAAAGLEVKVWGAERAARLLARLGIRS